MLGIVNRAAQAGRHDRRRRRQPARRPAQHVGRDRRPNATSSSATRAWATRSRRRWACGWRSPTGEVYVFIGDGTYLMNPTELATAVQEGLKITVVISKNDGFQCIRDLQLRSSGQDFGNEFRDARPRSNRLDGDYVADRLRRERGELRRPRLERRARRRARAALAEARDETRPCVIVVETDRYRRGPGSGVWWDVAPAEVSPTR